MIDWKKALLREESSIVDAIKAIDNRELQIGIVVTHDGKLSGTVTDGDVRRAILAGTSLDAPVINIMNKKPIFASEGSSRQVITRLFRKHAIRQIPLLAKDGRVSGVELIDSIASC